VLVSLPSWRYIYVIDVLDTSESMLGRGIEQDHFVAFVAASCLFRSSISLNRAWTSTEQVTGRAVVGCDVGRDVGDRVELAGRAVLGRDVGRIVVGRDVGDRVELAGRAVLGRNVGRIVVGRDVVEDEGPHVAPGTTW
jgi:hypothetical protein